MLLSKKLTHIWLQLKWAILTLVCFQSFCGWHKFHSETKWFQLITSLYTWIKCIDFSCAPKQSFSPLRSSLSSCVVSGRFQSLYYENTPQPIKVLHTSIPVLHGLRSSSCTLLIYSGINLANGFENIFPFREVHIFHDLTCLLMCNSNKHLGRICWQIVSGVRMCS